MDAVATTNEPVCILTGRTTSYLHSENSLHTTHQWLLSTMDNTPIPILPPIASQMFTPSHDRITETHDKKFKCPTCVKSFGYRSHLNRHIKVKHMGVKDLECTTCKKRFAASTDLRLHIERVHQPKTREVCVYCGEQFKVRPDYNMHIKSCHAKTSTNKM